MSLDNDHNLKESVQVLNSHKLNDLVKLLVFGYIEDKGYYSKGDEAKLAFLSLLYGKDDNSISPMAINLIRDMPDSHVFRVDLGHLLLGQAENDEYKVSLDTFMWLLIFYSSKHYRNIKQNLIEAIKNLDKYCTEKNGYIILERFPRVKEDLVTLRKIADKAESPNNKHEANPSVFANVINFIGAELLRYVEEHGEKILVKHNMAAVSGAGGSAASGNDLEKVLNAMFEIFKAGYYPASISSVLPDTIFATMDVGGASSISGQADYLLTLPEMKYFNAKTNDTDEGKVVRVVLRGVYATTCILNENYERWSHIEKRLPGAWKLFKIIYNRLKDGEYDTKEHEFSSYRLPFVREDINNEDIQEASKVSWLALFSSFIMGHVLNLIGRRNAKHLYKVAAPVVRLSKDNIFLVPNKLYDLDKVVVRYNLEGGKELKPVFEGDWLKYIADDYYTSTSNNPTGGVGYNAKYSLIVTQQSDQIPKEITINASDSNVAEWQEVVEGKVVADDGDIQSLELVFYDDDGKAIDIATIEATGQEGDFIEPRELTVRKTEQNDSSDLN